MVTATLPSLTDENNNAEGNKGSRRESNVRHSRQSIAFSVESELTITPERYTRTVSNERVPGAEQGAPQPSKASALAGFVGLFTGCGALVALVLFLPLPTKFGEIEDVTPGEAVSYSFYVVGAISFLVAIFVFVGLRNLRGEEGKGWSVLLGLNKDHRGRALDAEDDGSRQKVYPEHCGPTASQANVVQRLYLICL